LALLINMHFTGFTHSIYIARDILILIIYFQTIRQLTQLY